MTETQDDHERAVQYDRHTTYHLYSIFSNIKDRSTYEDVSRIASEIATEFLAEEPDGMVTGEHVVESITVGELFRIKEQIGEIWYAYAKDDLDEEKHDVLTDIERAKGLLGSVYESYAGKEWADL